MYVLDALDFHTRMKPNDIAIVHEGGIATFQFLRRSVRGAAARVRAAGLNPDQPVGIYVSDPYLHLVLVLALMHEAIPSFSGHPNYDAPPAGPEFGGYLCDRPMPFMTGATIVSVDKGWAAPRQQNDPPIERRSFKTAQSLVRIAASSGTTGVQKPVGFTAELVDRSMEFPAKIGSLGEHPSITMIGLSSSLGFRHQLGHLQLGNQQVLVSGQLDAVNAILRHQVQFLTASPAQLQAILSVIEQRAMRLPSLKHVRVAGSAVSPLMILRVRTRLCPNVTGDYGATEVGMIAEAPAELMEHIPGCAGYVHPWNQVEIVDDADRPLPAGTDGIVRIRSKAIVTSYIGEHAENQTAFKNGWFYPGDLGSLSPEGLLVIAGRATEIINAGGVKVSPNLINNVLTSVNGVADAASFGVDFPDRPTEIWAAVVAPREFDEKKLIETCISTLNNRAPRRIVRVDQIPRNTMGKILTAELRKQVIGR